MKKELVILDWEEQNSFADSRRANNGGGYSQPQITFMYDGIEGVFNDTSCGDFGTRKWLSWNGKTIHWGTMEGLGEPDYFPEEWDDTFREEILEKLETWVPYKESDRD